jgi:protein FRA10AC1
MAKRARDEDLDSEFEFSSEKKKKSWRDDPLAVHKTGMSVPHHSVAIPSKQLVTHEYDKEEWRARRYHYLSMDAYSRHKALVNHYLLFSGHGIEHVKRSTEKDRNDYSVLGEQHRFLWEEGDRVDTWEQKLAKSYYDRLFKEYAICDLSRYKENKIALRWRVEKEVVDGKGQFVCGNKHCSKIKDLRSWEVNFNYLEHGERKQALVKVRLCEECSGKLNYHHQRKLWKHKGRKKEAEKASKSTKSKHKKERVKRKEKRREEHGKHKEKQKQKASAAESESSDTDDEHSEEEREGGGREDGRSVWNKSAQAALGRSREDEFEDYFKDMLL